MLRSEVPWFQRFIKICQFYFQFTDELDDDGLQDMDYDVMKQVIHCQGKRVVWITKQYFENGFKPAKSEIRDSWLRKGSTD